MASNSVYRILNLFVAADLARRVESCSGYVASPHPGLRHDCIFIVCDECGSVSHADLDPPDGGLRHLAGGAGFAVRRPVMEVLGRCADCLAGPRGPDRSNPNDRGRQDGGDRERAGG